MTKYVRHASSCVLVLGLFVPVHAGVLYDEPKGGWTYTYNGDQADNAVNAALDGTWNHDNDKDEWDGQDIGGTTPGGVSVITEGDDTFLRIQDTGVPDRYGFVHFGGNYQIYFTRDAVELNDLTERFLDEGFTFSFRARLPLGEGLDDHHPESGDEPIPWPDEGLGNIITHDGLSHISFRQPEGRRDTLGFALATPRPEVNPALNESGLLLNSLNGDFPFNGAGDTIPVKGHAAGHGELNLLPIADLTRWNEFWVTVEEGGEGTHLVDVYMNGSMTPERFQVTASANSDEPFRSMGIGSQNRQIATAIDVDFISFKPGVIGPGAVLQAGDADQDLKFDQLDLVLVQIAGKFLTGETATWGEGDWDGAPGGSPGSPPAGDGIFNQLDIIAAQQTGIYLSGPYAAIGPNGQISDGQTSVLYDAQTGEVSVDTPAGSELTSINIDSAADIFTGQAAQNLGGSFDNDADNNIFKATFGGSFGSVSFGNVAQTGLAQEFVLGDLTVVGSLAGGGDLGGVDLIYVPEPSSVLSFILGTLALFVCLRQHAQRPRTFL